jgi:hypothetical protein
MTRLVLDPRAFWLTLLHRPEESPWGKLGAAWRSGKTTLCLSPGLMAHYVGPIQGQEATDLGIDEELLSRIGWLLRQRAEWYQPEPGPELVGEPWDRLAWLVMAAKPDALLVADEDLADWPEPIGAPVLTMPEDRFL